MQSFEFLQKGKKLFNAYLKISPLGISYSKTSRKINLTIECNVDENWEMPEASYTNNSFLQGHQFEICTII